MSDNSHVISPAAAQSKVLVFASDSEQGHSVSLLVQRVGFRSVLEASDIQLVSDVVATGIVRAVLLVMDAEAAEAPGLVAGLRAAGARAQKPLAIFMLAPQPPRTPVPARIHLGIDQLLIEPFDPLDFEEQFSRVFESTSSAQETTRSGSGSSHRTAIAALAQVAGLIEQREDVSGKHTERVGNLSAAIAEAMGLDEHEVETLRLAAQLHDLGKASVGDAVILKPSRLTNEEFERLKSHASAGARLLAGTGVPLLDAAAEIAATHHESWNGSGYPEGLKGDAIPLRGRIVALADFFDSLTHDRMYRRAVPRDVVLETIKTNAKEQFDPTVVAAFLEIADSWEEIESGSKVEVGVGAEAGAGANESRKQSTERVGA